TNLQSQTLTTTKTPHPTRTIWTLQHSVATDKSPSQQLLAFHPSSSKVPLANSPVEVVSRRLVPNRVWRKLRQFNHIGFLNKQISATLSAACPIFQLMPRARVII